MMNSRYQLAGKSSREILEVETECQMRDKWRLELGNEVNGCRVVESDKHGSILRISPSVQFAALAHPRRKFENLLPPICCKVFARIDANVLIRIDADWAVDRRDGLR